MPLFNSKKKRRKMSERSKGKNEGKRHTMEEMLREGIIRHILSDQQALVPLGATADQIDQSLVTEVPNHSSFVNKLMRVGP